MGVLAVTNGGSRGGLGYERENKTTADDRHDPRRAGRGSCHRLAAGRLPRFAATLSLRAVLGVSFTQVKSGYVARAGNLAVVCGIYKDKG